MLSSLKFLAVAAVISTAAASQAHSKISCPNDDSMDICFFPSSTCGGFDQLEPTTKAMVTKECNKIAKASISLLPMALQAVDAQMFGGVKAAATCDGNCAKITGSPANLCTDGLFGRRSELVAFVAGANLDLDGSCKSLGGAKPGPGDNMAGANGNTGGNMGGNMGDNMGGGDTGGDGTMPGMGGNMGGGGNSSDMGGDGKAMGGTDGKDKAAAGSKDKDAAKDKAELMGIKMALSAQCGGKAGANGTMPGMGGGNMGGGNMGGGNMGGDGMGGGGNRTRRGGHLAGKSCDELKGMLKVAMAKDASKGKEAGQAGETAGSKGKDAAGSKDKDAAGSKDKDAAKDKAELMGIKKELGARCGEGKGKPAKGNRTRRGGHLAGKSCDELNGMLKAAMAKDAVGSKDKDAAGSKDKDAAKDKAELMGIKKELGARCGEGKGKPAKGNRTRRGAHLAGKSCDELKGMLKVAMAKDSKGKEAGKAGEAGEAGSKGKDATGSKGAGTKAEKKAKAKGTLKLKGAALKGAFDKFKAKGCAAAGKGKAMPAGKGKAPAPARSRRGNHTGAADMTCAQLTTAFEAKKGEARAMYAQLKQARDTCAKAGSSNTTRAARSAAAADAVDLAELSCAELEEEIASLKTQASAAGLTLEALGLTTVSGTTASGGESGAGAVAAGASALVAIAFAQLA